MNSKVDVSKMNRVMVFVVFIFCMLVFWNTNDLKADVLDNPEQIIFENYGREIGLSNMSVSSIFQDNSGFMWFGTQGGLNMYDSSNMSVYSHNPFTEQGLPNNLVQTMYYDEDENVIWIGTYQGLSRFDINSTTFTNYSVEDNNISNEIIISITKDASGLIWFGTMDGLNSLNPESNEVKSYDIPSEVVRDVLVDEKNRLLIATYEGLHQFNYVTETIEKVDIDLPSKYVMALEENEEGTLTVGMWAGGVVNVDVDTLTIEDVIIENENIYSLLYTSDQHLYIGTWGNGLFVTKEEKDTFHFESSSAEHRLPHPIVYSIFEDSSGLVWIGTNGGGLSVVNKDKSNKVIHSYDEDQVNSLANGKINRIYKNNQYYYFAIYNQGVNVYDSVSEEMLFYQHVEDDPSSLSNNNVNDIIEYDSNRLLFATNSGIDIYDKTTKQFERSYIVPDDYIIYSLFLKENILWIGTYNNGLFKYHLESNTLESANDIITDTPISNSLINDIFIDSKERIWVATNRGLNLLTEDGETYRNTVFLYNGFDTEQLGSDIAKVVFEDSESNIWIGTNGGGISVYNEDNTFTTYTTKEGLSSNIVTGINEDTQKQLWIGTQNGISRINISSRIITNYNLDDGIGGYYYSSNVYQDNDSILFGGNHGITAIKESYNPLSSYTPKIYITRVDVLQQPLNHESKLLNDVEIILPYHENSLGFEFTSLNYANSKMHVVEYQLIGYDTNPIQSEDAEYVHYSNLPPGEYTFKVVSYLKDTEKKEIAEFHFEIEVPWYKTIYAYFIYSVLVIGVLYSGAKLHQSRVFKEKNKELKLLNSKLQLLSIEDPLTKAYNRRYFDQSFTDLISISIRSGSSISLLLFDIDDFKKINDQHGHIIGDKILHELTKRVQLTLKRSTDFVSRIGGDEFAVVMYDTEADGALLVAKRIKKAIEAPSSVNNIVFTISAGLVTKRPVEKDTVTSLLELADSALYTAKSNGKSKIEIYKKSSS